MSRKERRRQEKGADVGVARRRERRNSLGKGIQEKMK